MSPNNQGLTLIELLVGIFIFVVLMISVAGFFNYFFDSYYFTLEGNKSLNQVRHSLDELSTELRQVRTSEEGAYPFEVVDNNEISFYADIDGNGRVEKVRYFLSGSSLYRGVIEPGELPVIYDSNNESVKLISEFINNQSQPLFYYYNQDWPVDEINNPLVQEHRLLSTRLVRVVLKVNTSPGLIEDVVLQTSVMIRNLKDNL